MQRAAGKAGLEKGSRGGVGLLGTKPGRLKE